MPETHSSSSNDTSPDLEITSVWEIVAQPGVYSALEAIARQYRRGENAPSWWTGDLAHEALVKMSQQRNLPPQPDRDAFEKAFAVQIQRILTDKYRAKSAKKRGGHWIRHSATRLLGVAASREHDGDLAALVEHYIRTRPLHAVIVWMTTDFELTVERIARILDRKPDTIRRKLLLAQAELREELEPRDDL